MPRIARVVIPDTPHHITQRGNRRQTTFFNEDDYAAYLALMAVSCRRANVAVWGYCLMPNHVHLIAVPSHADGLRAAIAEAHRRYTRRINERNGWRGHLWQERFASFPMDEAHCLAAARYIELNPVRAGLVDRPEQWRWSSAAAHLDGRNDALVQAEPLLNEVGDWADFLAEPAEEENLELLRLHERTGRPLGAEDFLNKLEHALDRRLRPRKRGRKPAKPK